MYFISFQQNMERMQSKLVPFHSFSFFVFSFTGKIFLFFEFFFLHQKDLDHLHSLQQVSPSRWSRLYAKIDCCKKSSFLQKAGLYKFCYKNDLSIQLLPLANGRTIGMILILCKKYCLLQKGSEKEKNEYEYLLIQIHTISGLDWILSQLKLDKTCLIELFTMQCFVLFLSSQSNVSCMWWVC